MTSNHYINRPKAKVAKGKAAETYVWDGKQHFHTSFTSVPLTDHERIVELEKRANRLAFRQTLTAVSVALIAVMMLIQVT